MITIILGLVVLESYPGSPTTDELRAFAHISTASTLHRYVVWIFELLQDNSWVHMYSFDKFLRDKMGREQSGSFDPAHITHLFMTREMHNISDIRKGNHTRKRKETESTSVRNGPICWNFNKAHGCRKADCDKRHICAVCDATDHGKSSCSGNR